MDNVFITVFLFCFSLLPMAYLRYYPFRVIATPREQRILIVGHLIIFASEFLLVAALFEPLAFSANFITLTLELEHRLDRKSVV